MVLGKTSVAQRTAWCTVHNLLVGTVDSARGILGGQKMFGFAVLGVIIQRIPAIKDEKKYVETLGGWVFRVAIVVSLGDVGAWPI